MNQKIKTLILTDGSFDHASSRIRAILYFDLFRELLQLSIRWIPRIPVKKQSSLYTYLIFPLFKRFNFLKLAFCIVFFKYELIYIQRFFLIKPFLKILKKRKAVIIYDFDDAIYLDVPGKNTNLGKTRNLLSSADHIIVSSNELASFCRNEGYKNVSVITSPVDPERFRYHQVKKEIPVIIGWIGSSYTSGFLKIVEKPLAEVSLKYPIKVLLVGTENNFKLQGTVTENVPWRYDSEPELIDQMDIGIMPLPDESYSKGKGGYKLFQYMAGGIPIVASPIGINTDIVRQGLNGFLAQSDHEWEKYLALLIENPELRKKLGEAARQDVFEKYSRKHCFELLSDIIIKHLQWKHKSSLS